MQQQITIWSKPACPQCDIIKNTLKQKSIAFIEKIIGVNATKEQLLEAVPTARSVPQVFVNGQHISVKDLPSYIH